MSFAHEYETIHDLLTVDINVTKMPVTSAIRLTRSELVICCRSQKLSLPLQVQYVRIRDEMTYKTLLTGVSHIRHYSIYDKNE